jgi:hypothetical protein
VSVDNLGRQLAMFLHPTAGHPVEAIDPGALMGAVVGVAFFSLLMTLVRVRILAVLCRLGALVCAMYPALVAWSWWTVNDPTGTLVVPEAGAIQRLVGWSLELPTLPDLGQARPPSGLEAFALAWAVALVAFFLVALKAGRSPR